MKRLIPFCLATLLILMLAMPKAIFAQPDEAEIKSKLPKMLGANNVGKEFWFTIPPCFEDESYGYANFVKIFITAPTKSLVTIEVPGKGFYRTRTTIPNDVIEVNITPVIGQPYTKGGRDPEVPEAVFSGAGIHIYSDDPLVVYCVVRYHWTSDGFLAIPVSSFGKEYIIAGHGVDAMFNAIWGYKLPNVSGIVAGYDDTRVRFTLGGNAVTKTAGGMKPGQTKEFTLQKGDVWMVSTKGDESDLTGSKVIATRPVGVVTGNQCNNIPTGNQWCDYTVEMDIPTFTWGMDYHVPKMPNRKYGSPIRIFAKEPNTKIYRDGRDIGTLPDAGGTEGRGWIQMRMVGMDVPPRSVVISGNKPIGVTLYNTGVQEDGYPRPNSDPFVMVMTPLQQYQREITFCTPGIMGGHGFNENYVSLVYETDSLGMMPEDMEFAQVSSGQFYWRKLRVRFPAIDELYNYNVEGKKFAVKLITLPGDGVYKIRSKKPFAAYSFGFSDYDSYGFPTSAALADLEKPDTLPPVPRWDRITCDGTVFGGIVTDKPDDPKIRSNLSMIVLHSEESYNYSFKYDAFIPGEAVTTNWKLEVIDKTQNAKAIITFTDRRGNDTTITFEYHATKLTIRPKWVDYGTFKLNTSKTQKFWAVNESAESPVLVDKLYLKSGAQNFDLKITDSRYPNLNLPIWIKPLDSLEFEVTFNAVAEGSYQDSIGVGDTCVFAFISYVKAKVGEPTIFVTDIDFGSVTVGKTVSKEFTITNNGSVDLVITGYNGPLDAVYTTDLPAIDGNGLMAKPLILTPGNPPLKYTVYFKPDAEKDYPDRIIFFNDATKIDSICLITGRGIAPGLESNSYDWGPRRIDRPNFSNDGPYPADNNFKIITLVNTGTDTVYVSSIELKQADKDAAFEFNRSAFTNMRILPGESTYIETWFRPQQVGEHIMEFGFTNTANSKTVTTLKGVGLLPRISTQNYDFDTTIVQDVSKKQTRKIRITNELYQWQDTVTIFDLVVDQPGAISIDGVNYGTEGFKFDKAAIGLPVTLQPGEYIEFDAEFVAQHIGPTRVSITTVSTAENEVTSVWDGYGISQFIRSSGDQTTICVGSLATLTTKIENYGSGDIKVLSLKLEPETDDVYFDNPLDAQGFDLASNTTKEIKIGFAPVVAGKKRVMLIINSTTRGHEWDTTYIDVEAVHYDRSVKLDIIRPNMDRPWPAVGDLINGHIMFESNAPFDMAQVKSLSIVVRYNGGISKVIPESIKVGSLLDGKFKIADNSLEINDKRGEFSLRLEAIGNNILNSAGEILKFTFGSYLWTDKDSTELSKVSTWVQAQGNLCIALTSQGDSVVIQPACVNLTRKVKLIGTNYSMSTINPNPVGIAGATLDYSIGLDAFTEITIYNSMGEIVAKPVSANMTVGNYSLNIPVEGLSSGKYFVKMVSGPYIDIKEMIVTK